MRALTDDSGTPTGAIVTVADVTESVRMRRELEQRATFDELTRCYNRASILSMLERTLGEHAQGAAGTGVVFLDLDRFKDLNDRLGHAAGDAYLVDVARRLMASVRGGDVVGRLGGDEFLVVCSGVDSASEAEQIAQRIIDTFAETSVDLGSEHVTPRASVGVAWCQGAGVSADALVARADQAMYEAKRQRLGRPVVLCAPARIADAA